VCVCVCEGGRGVQSNYWRDSFFPKYQTLFRFLLPNPIRAVNRKNTSTQQKLLCMTDLNFGIFVSVGASRTVMELSTHPSNTSTVLSHSKKFQYNTSLLGIPVEIEYEYLFEYWNSLLLLMD